MKSNYQFFARVSLILLAFGIAAGAMGSHLMKKLLEEQDLSTWEIGVKYLLFQSLGMLIISLKSRLFNDRLFIGLILLLSGTLVFMSSLLLHSTRALWASSDFKTMAMFAPIGGVLMILGWLFVGIFCFHSGDEEKSERKKHRHHSRSSGNSEEQ